MSKRFAHCLIIIGPWIFVQKKKTETDCIFYYFCTQKEKKERKSPRCLKENFLLSLSPQPRTFFLNFFFNIKKTVTLLKLYFTTVYVCKIANMILCILVISFGHLLIITYYYIIYDISSRLQSQTILLA